MIGLIYFLLGAGISTLIVEKEDAIRCLAAAALSIIVFLLLGLLIKTQTIVFIIPIEIMMLTTSGFLITLGIRYKKHYWY